MVQQPARTIVHEEILALAPWRGKRDKFQRRLVRGEQIADKAQETRQHGTRANGEIEEPRLATAPLRTRVRFIIAISSSSSRVTCHFVAQAVCVRMVAEPHGIDRGYPGVEDEEEKVVVVACTDTVGRKRAVMV